MQFAAQHSLGAGTNLGMFPAGGWWVLPPGSSATSSNPAASQNSVPASQLPCWTGPDPMSGMRPPWASIGAGCGTQLGQAGVGPSSRRQKAAQVAPPVPAPSVPARAGKPQARKCARKVVPPSRRQLLTRRSSSSVRASAIAARLTWAVRAPRKSGAGQTGTAVTSGGQGNSVEKRSGSAPCAGGTKPPTDRRRSLPTSRPPTLPAARRNPGVPARVERPKARPKAGTRLVKVGGSAPKKITAVTRDDLGSARSKTTKIPGRAATSSTHPSDMLLKLVEAASHYERRASSEDEELTDNSRNVCCATHEFESAAIEEQEDSFIVPRPVPGVLATAAESEAEAGQPVSVEQLQSTIGRDDSGSDEAGGEDGGNHGSCRGGVWANLSLLGDSCSTEVSNSISLLLLFGICVVGKRNVQCSQSLHIGIYFSALTV
jgi:hypothetical protein